MQIALNAVTSSNIAAVGYDESSRTLRVQFTSGRTYDYADVPPGLAVELLSALSIGSFFAREIRAHYQGTPVAAEPVSPTTS
jgi:hypothetical protein